MTNSTQIIIVLYKTTLQNCRSYQSIVKYIDNTDINFNLLIYNNSPEVQIDEVSNAVIINAYKNEMLVGAYNFALKQAKTAGYQWLLLLDQDTDLSQSFLDCINDFVHDEDNSRYAAAVPIIKQGIIHHSPISYDTRKGPFMRFKCVTEEESHKKNRCISAFNSGTLLNVDFMLSIGGFSENYPLDMLDHWYFLQIHRQKQKIKVLNTEINQRLSLINLAEEMSVERFANYLKSLNRFSKELKGISALHLKILLLRMSASHLVRKEKRKFLSTTLKALFG